MALATGTVVQLKSGGPEMTINGIIGDANNPISKTVETGLKMGGYVDGDVYCQWFNESNKLESGCFKPAMLDDDEE
ncbi:DUF2158 domain-containing protein [uncultured Draconibacterium sp.]|uniref:DUF2158 domain-containing protein n=1 Tax=uncultured Draconibacterium sp. TaxID=1573823 RepID=UPI0029C64EAA|nr:DUF2158 domain-containing protein [uncultured Draconibacterium sp.]